MITGTPQGRSCLSANTLAGSSTTSGIPVESLSEREAQHANNELSSIRGTMQFRLSRTTTIVIVGFVFQKWKSGMDICLCLFPCPQPLVDMCGARYAYQNTGRDTHEEEILYRPMFRHAIDALSFISLT
jgi:hypothetical protein